jgi:hypothetical protein
MRKKNRRIILGMVALGRITPAEAERLLAAANTGEGLWMVIALLTLSLLTQLDPRLALPVLVLPQLAHAAHTLLTGLTVHHALALHLIGGM